MSNTPAPRRRQILRLDNGRFLSVTLYDGKNPFLVIHQGRTNKGADRWSRSLLYRTEGLGNVLKQLHKFRTAFDSADLSSFPGEDARLAWLKSPTPRLDFFSVKQRKGKSGAFYLLITRAPGADESKETTIGIFREEVEPVQQFLEHQMRGLQALMEGTAPESACPGLPGVETPLLTEIFVEADELPQQDEDEIEYSDEEEALLERCEGYPGLVDLAEERIALARQLEKLERATNDPEILKLEAELARIKVDIEKAHAKIDSAAVETLLDLARRLARFDRSRHSRAAKQLEAAMAKILEELAPRAAAELITNLSAHRQGWIAKMKRERDKIPVHIEEQMEDIRARIEEIDSELELEISREEDYRRRNK